MAIRGSRLAAGAACRRRDGRLRRRAGGRQ